MQVGKLIKIGSSNIWHLYMELYKKVNHYWKLCQALGISVPPNMLSRIVDFAVGSVAYRTLNLLNYALETGELQNNKEIEHIKQELIKYNHRAAGIKVNHSWDFDRAFIHLDFDNWKTPIGDPEQIYDALIKQRITGISCEIKYTGSDEGLAMWEASKLTMTLFINLPRTNTIENFQKIVNKMHSFEKFIETSVKHELIHFVQNVGNFIKHTSGEFGLPPKKVRNKLVDPYGRAKQENPEQIQMMTPHAFIDAEFYTNLNDSIQTFKYFADKMNENLRRLFFKIFIGIASNNEINTFLDENKTIPKIVGTKGYWWFRDLKNDPPRWRVAIKKFVDAVS